MGLAFSWEGSLKTVQRVSYVGSLIWSRDGASGTKPNIVRQTAQDCVDLVAEIADVLIAGAVRHYHGP